MAKNTGIAWTHHTANIVWGCTPTSPGCARCYAETLAKRYGHNVWGPASDERRVFGEKHWNEPLKWNKEAEAAGERHRVFSSSMGDIFEDHPVVAGELLKLWPLIRATPWLDWQLLTKRTERIAANLPEDWGDGYDNVLLGTSIENQRFAYRADILAGIPARRRFISAEPLLGPVRLLPDTMDRLHWIIVGGESGSGHRPMEIAWVQSLFDQCRAHGVAYFAKQDHGARSGMRGRFPDHLWVQEFPR